MTPHDDPYHDFTRVFQHFYDPALNRPLTGNNAVESSVLSYLNSWEGITPHSSPSWTIGAVNAMVDPNQPDTGRWNHFTVMDARESMFRALTGMRRDGAPAGINEAPLFEQDRYAYWATLFRSLGDVMHNVQDMGQPQHTRNDLHSPVNSREKQYYEAYVNAMAKGEKGLLVTLVDTGADKVGLDVKEIILSPRFSYDGYDVPVVHAYTELWSTHQGRFNVANGRGLADYSNRGFFTAGTNLGENGYVYPPNNPVSEEYDHSPYYAPFDDNRLYRVLSYRVKDIYSGQEDKVRVTTESALTKFLSGQHHYMLSTANYDDMARVLIPRAVAYSAGMINYFFRGRLEIAPPDDGVYGLIDATANQGVKFPGIPVTVDSKGNNTDTVFGFNTIKLKASNVSPQGEDMGADGKLYLVAKYRRNMCYQGNLIGEYGWSQPGTFPPGCNEATFTGGEEYISVSEPQLVTHDIREPTAYTFTFTANQTIPVNAYNLVLQLVYRGKLGNEADAVVVATKDIFEPVYFAQLNDTDTLCVGEKFVMNTPAGIATLTQADHDTLGFLVDVAPVTFQNIGFQFGTATSPQVVVDSLLPGEYARIVFLTDTNPTQLTRILNTVVTSGTEKLTWDPATINSAVSRVVLASPGKLAADSTSIRSFRNTGYHYQDRLVLEPAKVSLCTATDTNAVSDHFGLPDYKPVDMSRLHVYFATSQAGTPAP